MQPDPHEDRCRGRAFNCHKRGPDDRETAACYFKEPFTTINQINRNISSVFRKLQKHLEDPWQEDTKPGPVEIIYLLLFFHCLRSVSTRIHVSAEIRSTALTKLTNLAANPGNVSLRTRDASLVAGTWRHSSVRMSRMQCAPALIMRCEVTTTPVHSPFAFRYSFVSLLSWRLRSPL